MTFVLPCSMPLFYFLTFLAAIPWIVSATRTRSSAISNSAGRPTLNSLDNASSTRTKSSGLRTEPWCTSTQTLKAFTSLHPCFRHCILIHCFFTNTIHSSTHSYLSEHQLNHLLWHHFKRFLRINKGHPQDWPSFFARYFPCSWRNIKLGICQTTSLPWIRTACCQFHISSLPTFNDSLQIFHSMLYNNSILMYESQANMHILFILVDTHQPIHVLTSVNVKQIAYLRKNAILAVATFKYTKMLQISFLHLKNFLGEGAHPPPPSPSPYSTPSASRSRLRRLSSDCPSSQNSLKYALLSRTGRRPKAWPIQA